MEQILHSKIYGEDKTATPLVILHGLFGMLDNWGTLGREFGEIYPTHLLDLRNHGKSFHSEEMSHNDLAEDIKNYLEFHNIHKANIIGHSLGGKAVMQFAIKYPEMVEKLIVVDISPKAYPPHHQATFKALKSVDFEVVKSRGEVEKILSEYIKDKSVVQFLAKNLYWTEEKKLAWRFNLPVLTEKYNEFVANAIKFGVFHGETLFISGEKSNYILPQDNFLIKQQFPKSHITYVKDAGHWVQAQKPREFAEIVKDFLSK